MKNTYTTKNIFLYLVFIGYIIMMLDFLFLGRMIINFQSQLSPAPRSVNLIPFVSIVEDIGAGRLGFNNNLLGNILIFIPMGIYVCLFKSVKNISGSLLIVFCVSLLNEIIQFITRTGVADIDDLILNCLGGLIGIFVYKLIARNKTADRARNLIIILASVVGIPVILLYILLMIVN